MVVQSLPGLDEAVSIVERHRRHYYDLSLSPSPISSKVSVLRASVDVIMSYYPFSLTSFRAPTIYPDTPNTTSIRNSPGRDSARGQGSSILTNGGFDDNKSSPSVRSLISTRNEEFPAFSGLSFGPGTSIQGRDSDFRRRNSFAGAPLSLQDGGFQSSQSFPTGFPSGVDQPDTTAGHATVVS